MVRIETNITVEMSRESFEAIERPFFEMRIKYFGADCIFSASVDAIILIGIRSGVNAHSISFD
jgi:phosphosulfolactate synthase (CoM biosynthesis protein A)